MKMKFFVLALTALCSSFSYARECRDTDTVYRYAKRTAYEVAEHYDGSRNVRVNVVSCDFDPYDEYYTINMYTYWDGSLSGDTYNVDGILKIRLDGSVISFDQTYKSKNVKDWQGVKSLFGAIDAMIRNSSDYSR